jgi:propanol-preferring alcohol dehydrogenase
MPVPEPSCGQVGQRVGLAWIFSACGHCSWCLSGQENLCNDFLARGRDRHGVYADYVVADANYCVAIPEQLTSTSAAPLLCGGAIGYRSLSLAGISDSEVLGLTGFGASNHLVLRIARVLYPASPIYVFARNDQLAAIDYPRHLWLE